MGESKAKETKTDARGLLSSCVALHQQEDVIFEAKYVVLHLKTFISDLLIAF